MPLTLAVTAREKRRIVKLEARMDELDNRILRLAARGFCSRSTKIIRLIGKRQSAMAEWNRLRWPRMN